MVFSFRQSAFYKLLPKTSTIICYYLLKYNIHIVLCNIIIFSDYTFNYIISVYFIFVLVNIKSNLRENITI